MDIFLAFIVAMSITMALIPPLSKAAERLHVLDAPAPRKVHSRPMPRVGGIAMAAGALTGLGVWLEPSISSLAFGGSVLILLAAGIWDDRSGLGYKTKFAAQIVAVVLVMTVGDVAITSITLTERIELPTWLATPLTFFFLLGVTNAINLADGLDGLAGGTSLLCLSALALLAISVGDVYVATIAMILAGSVMGFLRYNTFPARVFMGDSGSQVLGFVVAYLCILLTQNVESPLSASLPLLLIGVPIIDTLTVVGQRLRDGRSPFKADRNHLHHRLLDVGLDHHEAVVAIYVTQIAFIQIAWLMRFESDILIVIVFLAIAGAALAPLLIIRNGRRPAPTRQRDEAAPFRLGPIVRRLAEPNHVPLWIRWIIGLTLLGFATVTAGLSQAVANYDIRILALALSAILVVAIWLRRGRSTAGWVERGALYIGVAVVAYLDYSRIDTPEWFSLSQWFLFPLLAGSIAMRFRLSGMRRYRVTPLDILVLFIALVIPNLPGSALSPPLSGLGIAKLVLLFYALETVFWEEKGLSNWVPSASATILLIVLGVPIFFT